MKSADRSDQSVRERIARTRMEKRKKNILIIRCLIAAMVLFIVAMGVIIIKVGILDGELGRSIRRSEGSSQLSPTAQRTEKQGAAKEEGETEETIIPEEVVLAEADVMAAQYKYEDAIRHVQSHPGYNTSVVLQNAAAGYTSRRDACVPWPVDQIPHVFFHTLIRDPDKAFDGDEREGGYNQFMTTISEFNAMIEQMYEKGYVMVSLHDMCTVAEDGTVSKNEIRLPEGKKPFVLSQDDVSYYHYMDGDGFAQKLIVDENGEVKNTYVEDDGSISVGDYDMVPLIDTFVKEHPDFSYRGHKGIIALTGYEGVLGYRTDEVYNTRQEDRLTKYQRAFLESHPDFDFEAEVREATKVAEAMKADGWEFASHTWGHINPLAAGYDAVVRDTTRFKENMEPIIGKTDVLIFAFGADINDWTPYTMDNEYFKYLKEQGFSIFCNVDGSKPYWVQFGSDYMRSGRRNLDGYTMYYNPDGLTDLFDVDSVWDDRRTTPVPAL